jgi:AraC-like DNA-binding protein
LDKNPATSQKRLTSRWFYWNFTPDKPKRDGTIVEFNVTFLQFFSETRSNMGAGDKMEIMDEKQLEREAQRENANREELVERLARSIPEDGSSDPLKGVRLWRVSEPTDAVYATAEPSLCIIAQGRKVTYTGDKAYPYDPYSYLLTTVGLPVVSRIMEASPEKPYLGFRMLLDPTLIGSVMVEIGQSSLPNQGSANALEVSPLDSTLLDTVLRLVRLLESPVESRILFPSISREIVYRLLMGQQSHRLHQMTVLGGHTHRISQAVEKMCREFNQPLRVEDMARQIGMSVSGFHHHFKAVTAMSPLQFQKQLRLQEARRLMLDEELDAASAGYRVGYDDASYFNREYKSVFGVPPRRDVESLRGTAEASSDI